MSERQFATASAGTGREQRSAGLATLSVCLSAAAHDAFVSRNLTDQNALAPDWVVTGPVWHMTPTVDFVIDALRTGCYTALDLRDFSMMAKGSASLAPFHGNGAVIPKKRWMRRTIGWTKSTRACTALPSTSRRRQTTR